MPRVHAITLRSILLLPVLLLFFVPSMLAWSAESEDEGKRFLLGVINERPERPSFALEQYGPLQMYLQSRLAARGIQIGDLVITRGLDEMAEQIKAGAVDAVIEGVMPTLKLQRQTDQLDIGLLVWRKGQRQYHSVFFTRQESPIRRLEQLGGKTVAFESPRSTSAYAIPRAALMEAGLRLAPLEAGPSSKLADADVVWFQFAGSELNQAYWVHAKRADAGAFNDGDWVRVPESIKSDLRVFHRTPPILRWLFSFARRVDPQVRTAVEDVLVTMHQEPAGRVALAAASRIAKFEPLTKEDRANLDYWEKALSLVDTSARP